VIIEMERRFTYRTPQEALDAVTKLLPFWRLDSERIEVGNAYGRILDQDLVAPVNLPSHDMSHFDGYAVRAEDTKDASVQNPVYFTVIGELYPGQSPNYEVHEDEAVYVTTGSFLPKGANAIVAVEATKRINARERSQIEVRSAVDLHEHVIDCGSDIQQGVTLFREGHKLRAQDISMLATLGVEQLSVVKQPAVAIICVGDELTDVVHESEPGKVVNSLRFTVSAMIQEAGGHPLYLGITPDNVAQLKEKIIEGIAITDIVLMIGGSSMGEKDITAAAINSLGNPGIIVHGLKRKPGRVSGFAMVQNTPIVMLPGLCHSTVVGFYTLALPVILAMSGCAAPDTQLVVNAKLTQQITFTSFIPFEQVTFVQLKRTPEGYLAEPYIASSSSYHALTCSNAFIITSPGTVTMQTGEEVEVHLLPSFFTLNSIFT
jgi:molybdenum cofactor synthesis domain-containing protein